MRWSFTCWKVLWFQILFILVGALPGSVALQVWLLGALVFNGWLGALVFKFGALVWWLVLQPSSLAIGWVGWSSCLVVVECPVWWLVGYCGLQVWCLIGWSARHRPQYVLSGIGYSGLWSSNWWLLPRLMSFSGYPHTLHTHLLTLLSSPRVPIGTKVARSVRCSQPTPAKLCRLWGAKAQGWSLKHEDQLTSRECSLWWRVKVETEIVFGPLST